MFDMSSFTFYSEYRFIILRSKETAIRAVQYLSLTSGGFYEPWASMQTGIRNIRQLVHNSLSRGAARRLEPINNITDDLYLTHRVFTMV